MESAAHLDVLKVGGTIDEQQYSRGIELLERDADQAHPPLTNTSTVAFPFKCTATVTGAITITTTIAATTTAPGFDGRL